MKKREKEEGKGQKRRRGKEEERRGVLISRILISGPWQL